MTNLSAFACLRNITTATISQMIVKASQNVDAED